MKNLTKEQLALLTIYSDSIHDILFEHDFVSDLKQAFRNIERGTKYVLKRAYGNQELEPLDEYRDDIMKYSLNLIDNKFTIDEKLTFENIKKIVCELSDISPDVVFMRTRKREILEARQIIQYFCLSELKYTAAKTGTLTGEYDHATVLNSKKTVLNLYDSDNNFKKLINKARKELNVLN